MTSRSTASCGASVVMVAIQTNAPSTSPGQIGLRPWKTREAFHTMPQDEETDRGQRQRGDLAERGRLQSVQVATAAEPSR